MFEERGADGKMGSRVTLGGGAARGSGYLSEPASSGPAVIVVHDYFGALPHVQERCDALALAGFMALAPDLYDGRSTTDPTEAQALLGQLDINRSRTLLTVAARQLRAHPKVQPERVGAVGFSAGGWLALLVATSGVLDAVVAYYAALGPGEQARIPCPVMLHFAEVDEWEPADLPVRFMAELRARGTMVAERTWPGTEHSFANADVPAWAPGPAGDAWADTVGFLARQLRRPTR
jgi:carboxymethylenebutenolidase